MWLDRLASQAHTSATSTPQSASRPYSPLPRRTSSSLGPYATTQRTSPSPRGSSLSLISNDSNTSLLSQQRKPNTSALRQSATAFNGPDPEDMLDQLLQVKPDEQTQSRSFVTEEDISLIPDFGGLSLRDLVSSETDQSEDTSISSSRQSGFQSYEKQRAGFDNLHRSISACDDVLNSVELNLTSFRNDLASVSADIESLQSRSTALTRRLDNRKNVEKVLGPLVEELSIPPEAISKIAEGHIDESWAKMLSEIDRRAAAHEKRSSSEQNKALEDLSPLLEKLIAKAVERIRDFLVAQIKALRSPHINAQIIQQQNFLRFKELFVFLHKHHSTLAEEISQAYMNTMRWYYLNQFTRYEKALEKIRLHHLDKHDVLGQEDTTRKTNVLTGSRIAGPPHDAFNLGRRIELVKSRNAAALSSYLAEEDQTTHYLEVPFRNFNLAVIDNATAEYTFLASFFSPALSFSKIAKTFNYIFDPTFELGRVLTKSLASETFDALGVFICIRVNNQLAFELQRRRVPAVESYVNATNMLLWPRLQMIMDKHCESVKALTNALPSKPSKAAADPKLSAAPHVVTQRFGQLLHGCLSLSTEAGDDEPVLASLRRLRADVEAFLSRQAQAYGSDKRKSERFLYNNYSLILTIIGDVTGKSAAEQQEYFEQLKKAHQDAM